MVLSVTTAACTSADVTIRPSPTLAGWPGGPSQLQSPIGTPRVAVAWPMGMRSFAPEVTEALIDWTPGTLQKVLLVQVASAPAFTIQGHRCSDGHPLRFSYRGLPPVTTSADGIRTPIPSIVMETEGETVVPFDAYENTTPGSHFFTGYMLFTSAGDWLIETRDTNDKVSWARPFSGSAPRHEPPRAFDSISGECSAPRSQRPLAAREPGLAGKSSGRLPS